MLALTLPCHSWLHEGKELQHRCTGLAEPLNILHSLKCDDWELSENLLTNYLRNPWNLREKKRHYLLC